MKKALCMICRKNTAIASCSLCGTLVCKEHYHNGLCSDCKRGKMLNDLS